MKLRHFRLLAKRSMPALCGLWSNVNHVTRPDTRNFTVRLDGHANRTLVPSMPYSCGSIYTKGPHCSQAIPYHLLSSNAFRVISRSHIRQAITKRSIKTIKILSKEKNNFAPKLIRFKKVIKGQGWAALIGRSTEKDFLTVILNN